MIASPRDQLVALLVDIEKNCDPPVGGERCQDFSLDCLSLIVHKVPPVAVDALKVLQEYRSRQVQLQSVLDTLVGLWQYLDQHETNLSESEVSAVRAVICLVHAQKEPRTEDMVDHMA